MSGYLIDTQVLLWWSAGNFQIGKQTRRIIGKSPGISFSSLSFAEIEMKKTLGKLQVSAELQRRISEQGAQELPFNILHALQIARFNSLVKHDPFDRLLLAQAAAENLTFITADQKLLDLGFDWILDARE